MHRDIARYLLLLALVRALVDVVLVSASPAGTRPRRRLRPATVTRHTVTDQRHVSPVTDHRPAPPVTGAGWPAPPQSARPDRASPSDLDISGTDQPPPRSRRATRRGRGGPRSRKRGCRGGQRWRACSRGRDDICITSININAIPRKILPLRHHLHGTVTDICLVQETWLKKPVPKRFTTFPGYNMVHADRENRTGGGVAILVRDSYQLTPLPRPDMVNAVAKLESVWARVSVARHRAILFASVYRPPSAPGTQLTADLEQMDAELEFMLSRHRGLVIICADTNCDMRYVTGNAAGAHLLSLLQKFQLCQVIDAPTFRSSGSTIDIIATNDRAAVVASGVQRCHFSPHDFTRALIRVRKCRPEPVTIKGRNWKRLDLDAFCNDIARRDWSYVFNTDDVALQTGHFLQNMTDVLDKHAPTRRVKLRNPCPPPLSRETKRLMVERRAALRGTDRDLYADVNRRVRAAMQRDARDSIERQIAEAGRSAMYRCIRPIIQGKSARGQQQPDIDSGTLNRYFADVGVTTAASVAAGLPADGGGALPVRLPRVGMANLARSRWSR